MSSEPGNSGDAPSLAKPLSGHISIDHDSFVRQRRRDPVVDSGRADFRNNVSRNFRDAFSHDGVPEAWQIRRGLVPHRDDSAQVMLSGYAAMQECVDGLGEALIGK